MIKNLKQIRTADSNLMAVQGNVRDIVIDTQKALLELKSRIVELESNSGSGGTGGNLNGEVISHTINSSISNQTFTHGLGYTPVMVLPQKCQIISFDGTSITFFYYNTSTPTINEKFLIIK